MSLLAYWDLFSVLVPLLLYWGLGFYRSFTCATTLIKFCRWLLSNSIYNLTPPVVVANMEPLAHLVKVSIPNYLAGLPIPESIGGWFRLGVRDWAALIPPTAVLAGIGYMSYKAFCPLARGPPCGRVNHTIKKDVNKVVDTVDIEDITEKVVYCRCWRSQNWPYCDGSHGRHNQETNDNVGPLVVTKKKD